MSASWRKLPTGEWPKRGENDRPAGDLNVVAADLEGESINASQKRRYKNTRNVLYGCGCNQRPLSLVVIDTFESNLAALAGASVELRDDDVQEEFGQANIVIVFENGSKLRACYWRLIETNDVISSFDHKQRYGLPAPIDAREHLRRSLAGKTLSVAAIDRESGDLHFLFAKTTKLQIFAFSSYEIWEISFPNGSVEYSNYARR
jgi:hypothetical protein